MNIGIAATALKHIRMDDVKKYGPTILSMLKTLKEMFWGKKSPSERTSGNDKLPSIETRVEQLENALKTLTGDAGVLEELNAEVNGLEQRIEILSARLIIFGSIAGAALVISVAMLIWLIVK
jgi:hypothetical protein